MIVTMGGRFGGYGLYLQKGKPVFVYNLVDLKRYRWEGGVGADDWLGSSLKPGKHTVAFDFKYDGAGFGKGGTGVLSVDGKELSRQKIEHTIPFLMAIDESFDMGLDTRTGVDESYKLPFRFSGTIDKLTFNLEKEQLTAEDRRGYFASPIRYVLRSCFRDHKNKSKVMNLAVQALVRGLFSGLT